MSVFILETDAVTSAADSLSSIESSLDNLSSSVNGYDTSQSSGDNFDFDGAKTVIAENIKAASIKVQNTQTIMNSVVDSHTKLQKALTTDESESSKSSNSGSSGNSGSSRNYSSGGYYSGGGYSTAGTAGVAATAASMAAKNKEKDKEKNKDKAEIIDVKNKINKVSYVYPNTKKLSEESKTIFNDIKYDDNGYAKLNDYYVISADKSIGSVGDIIKFTKEDGTTETYVIGINTVSDKYKNTVSFIVSEDKVSEFKPLELTDNLLKDNNKIENCGNYKTFDKQKITATGTIENNTNNENPKETLKNETTETNEVSNTNTLESEDK